MVVLQKVREAGPVVLIPAAWTAAAAAELGYMASEGMFIAHIIMAAFITFFIVTGWDDLGVGALRAWRIVLVIGLGLTLAGLTGFLVDGGGTPLFLVSLVGWMLLPAGGLVYTGFELPSTAARIIYIGGAALSVLGALLFVLSLMGENGTIAAVGFVLVGLGQTIGILDAVRR